MNMALKVAIVQSGQTSRAIAQRARIPEVRLSGIVRGRFVATDDEKAALGKTLRRDVADIFPSEEAVAS